MTGVVGSMNIMKAIKLFLKMLEEKVNGVMLIDMDLERKHYNRKTYDLCQDCMRELNYFLEGAQNNERL